MRLITDPLLIIRFSAFLLVILFSCKRPVLRGDNVLFQDNFCHDHGLEEREIFFGFVSTPPPGAVVKQKMIPAPRFLQARFAELGIIPPEKIQIAYWLRKCGSVGGVMQEVQFLEYSDYDTLNPFPENEKCRISFTHKYADDSIQNSLEGYCDYFGKEIKITQWYGQMTETNTFLEVGNQTIYLKEIGKRDSEYSIRMNDTLVRQGYDEETVIFYHSDSLQRIILE